MLEEYQCLFLFKRLMKDLVFGRFNKNNRDIPGFEFNDGTLLIHGWAYQNYFNDQEENFLIKHKLLELMGDARLFMITYLFE